ncbi:recombinase family protein [Microlunatus parietis]
MRHGSFGFRSCDFPAARGLLRPRPTVSQAQRGSDPDGLSIPAQREANRHRALELGALVVAEFIERGRSGRSMERPELRQMLAYLQTRPVDFVIVHKIDRLARNRADDSAITNLITGTGARLVSTAEPINTTPGGRLLHGIMASIAEFYSHNLATEVMKGMRQKANQGGTPGRAPLGYLNQRHHEGDGREIRTVCVDSERGPHITWAFNTYATGQWSITQLADELNTRGLTTRPGPNTAARPLTLRSVHHLLRNPYYKGVVTFNGVESPEQHEPLIDPVTWAAVQDILTAHRNGERSRTHDHYLKGTVYCIKCGRRLIVQHTRTRSGRVYEYFVCHRRGNFDCPQRRALPIADVEQRVADSYRNLTLTAELRDRIEQVAVAGLHHQKAAKAERLHNLIKQGRTLEANRGKLLDAYYSDAIPRDLFLAEQRRLKIEHARINRERATIETDHATIERQTRDALDLLQDVHTTYERATEPIRKQLNRAVFERVLIGYEPDQIRVELNDPYRELVSPDNESSTETDF